MHPFIGLGDRIVLDAWQVLTAGGVLAGALVAWVMLREPLRNTRATVITILVVGGAVLGADLAHGLLSGFIQAGPPRETTHTWRGGYSLFGAFASSALVLLVASRILPGVPFWVTADAFSVGAPLGLFFARIGCYMRGCCWGTPLPEGHPFYGLSVKLVHNRLLVLHPVQLYSAAAALGLFLCLLYVRGRSRVPGLLATLFVILYAGARFFLEFFRADTRAHLLLGPLTLYQWICLALVPAGVACLFMRLRIAPP